MQATFCTTMTSTNKPSCVADLVPFSDLSAVLDAVSKASKKDRRRAILAKFIESWRDAHSKLHSQGDQTDDSFYPALRLILPSFDKDRGNYGFKEHMLAKKFISVFCLAPHSQDARCLLEYRKPQSSTTSEIGDFASTCAEVLQSRLPSQGTLTITELNSILDAIVDANADKDKARAELQLEKLCRALTSTQLKWLVRILLKQMKIGVSESTVFAVFHPDASKLYDVTTSLKQVAEKLHNRSVTMDEIQIELFQPFRPMLAARVPPEKVVDIMHNEPFYVETKYDGERVQVHKDAHNYKYFSRNGNDFTTSYGHSPSTGSLTPHLHSLFVDSVQSCILDAEMVGWNPAAKCIATKGENFDVKSLRDGDDLNPCLVVFDCLMLNGKVLSAQPLSDRLKILENDIFKQEMAGRLMLAKRETKRTCNELIACLNSAIEAREEGIVVKRMNATYQLNVRSEAAGWLKIKPDYIDALNDDFDLCIVGGYFGEGPRSNIMSHFLLALAQPATAPDEKPTKFHTVCKVGSGYKVKELYDLNVHLNQSGALSLARSKKVPEWLVVGTERPEVFIKPEMSKIIQVRAAEITRSDSYAVGYTLRFPRAQKIRTDKDWCDCMTTIEFDKLRQATAFQECDGKIAHRLQLASTTTADESLSTTGGTQQARKRQRQTATAGARGVIKPSVPSYLRADRSKVARVTNVFEGKELCVFVDNPLGSDKDLLTKTVKELGGVVALNAGAQTWCVVANSARIRSVQNIIKSKLLNVPVAKSDWLLKCRQQQRLVDWAPSDLWHATEMEQAKFGQSFDCFGDSYTESITAKQLSEIFNAMPNELPPVSTSELNEAKEELHAVDHKYTLFTGVSLYVDRYMSLVTLSTPSNHVLPIRQSALELCELDAKMYGATISAILDDKCTHVVMDKTDLSRLSSINEQNRQRNRKFRLITATWVSQCIAEGRRLDEDAFHPLSEC